MKQYFSQRLPLPVLFFLFLSVSLSAQDARVSISLRDASLKELFRAIEEQTSYSFSYRDSELEGKPAVNVQVTDVRLNSLLSSELAKAGLQYTLVEDKIVVTPLSSRDGAPMTLSGTVKDRSGQPVIGASAMIKGTMTGAVTDLDGRFSISVHKGDVLVFSSLGYVTEEYRVGSIANVDINTSEATHFSVSKEDKHVIIPPFTAIDGLGANVAKSIVEARNAHPFLSKEDILKRTQLSGTMLKKLETLGAIGEMSESNQMSLF